MTTAPYWVSQATKGELLLFLTFWEQLSSEERQAYMWSNVLHYGSGEIGQKLGYTDIQDHRITMCGNPLVYAPRSAQAQSILDSIENKWDALFRESGLVAETKEPHALVRKVVDIPCAFHEMVCEMLGLDKRYMIHNFREESVKRQKQLMVDFVLDIVPFLPSARTWIDKNS